ncbi:Conidial yellow pigment biosynthesis polyketide synthase [Fusarium austroafricanum]|uniref:Conidial yellow pigment biosynthesis polyketide synthase n=1 Tax=Fusarium austroafricanum TaxID=2364996 RepID=A0A8H4KS44_9HYPO|nr:Conidial yellow pigment biosynthesis polyketide synthase [Fusarium austroafricanum]
MGELQDSLTNGQKASVLLFGSQVESLTKESYGEIHKALQDVASHDWILSTLDGLPSYLDALSQNVPQVTDTIIAQGKQLLSNVISHVRSGPDGLAFSSEALPSVILSPLVVLTQIIQYRQFLIVTQQGQNKTGDEAFDPQAAIVGQKTASTLGFCMGLLGAYAVASSSNISELDKYGAVAVRLALVGGALIDAQQEQNPSKSYAIAWSNKKQRDDIQRVVDSLYPEAYISVLYDEARATVTTSERGAAKLLRQLRAAGITTAEVGFKGDIHSPRPESRENVEALIAFCNKNDHLRLPDSSSLAMPTYTNAGDGKPITSGAGSMHEIALRTVFSKQCDWYGSSAAVKTTHLDGNTDLMVAFGPDRCVPPTLMRQLGSRLVHFSDVPFEYATSEKQTNTVSPSEEQEEPIAVVGMSIKVAGADDVHEFSDMLRTGKSQHQIIPPERMVFDSLFREKDPSRKWYANLMKDVDAFDHKFFKRSPRESAAMDPQQRLLLQASYQAVEQAGYFTESIRNPKSDAEEVERQKIGVYMGAPAVDYEHNVAGHAANAFTATGNLQSFLAGRVAHHFGWTGPAMTLDTACSSSAVAIHLACRNLVAGECNAALAGGVALFTNPLWFQNLAAANFLSPTGQCKPFDQAADGFCRAEGIACVMLKRMSDAVADGNTILGCIASSAVYQNQNSTPMFVPNSPSLSQLFKDVIQQANVKPGDVSLVEAHGTGTPVGDPAEYEAIRLALGGPTVRSEPLPLGSAKGHVGHTEGASGVVSLIKVLTMMRENYIPPQASFTKMNPLIRSSPSDKIQVVTSLRPWVKNAGSKYNKVALINNYGAGGSNAAMVVSQSPLSGFAPEPDSIIGNNPNGQTARLPFFISGADGQSIKAYASKLIAFMQSHSKPLSLADLSFALGRHSNPDLSHRLVFSARSVEDLRSKLSEVASSKSPSPELAIHKTKPQRPVILCFGGQISTFVGLTQEVYESVNILRKHLNDCDAMIQSLPLGLGSMFPDIFSRTPFTDPVRLQTMLFSLQYACAKSWIDCGLKIAAVVGHSFGELTALCISGALPLLDAIKLVAGRAQLVRDAWGSERGAMMAVEADESLVHELISSQPNENHPASIACYNGPRSFTLAGSHKAIDEVAEILTKDNRFSAIKHKKLNVTNAFHSSLVDPLISSLEDVGKSLVFQKPSIHLERATETRLPGPLTSNMVPDHMRKPVFFRHALQRLARDYPSAIFLEAGSNSTITTMASRALTEKNGSSSPHSFQGLNISDGGSLDGLTDATVSLQKQGVRVSFWAHHAAQTCGYEGLILPPYQFEKSRHWLELKSSTEAVATEAARLAGSAQTRYHPEEVDEKHLGLFTFTGYQDKDEKATIARFSINTGSDKYLKLVSGHLIAETAPVCPGTLQIDMAIEALFSIRPEWKSKNLEPVLHNMVNHAPLCLDPERNVRLDLECTNSDETHWEWNISSLPRDTNSTSKDTRLHVNGRFEIRSSDDEAFVAEFSRFERLVGFSSCAALLATAGRDEPEEEAEVLQGRNVYRAFSKFVDYSDIYRGVRSVVGRSGECAGRIHRRHSGDSWLDVLLDDCFGQVSGLWVNCMTDIGPENMYIATGCEMLMRSPRKVLHADQAQDIWHVYARSTRQSDTAYTTDVFVFNASNGQLAEVLLGIQYTQVPKEMMRKMLVSMTKDASVVTCKQGPVIIQDATETSAGNLGRQGINGSPVKAKPQGRKQKKPSKPATPKGPNHTNETKRIVATVAGMQVEDISLETQLADVGIDSLMGMELRREINLVFKVDIDQGELLQATSVGQLVELITRLAPATGQSNDEMSDGETSEEDGWSSTNQENALVTPASPPDTSSAPSENGKDRGYDLDTDDILDCFAKVKLQTDKKLVDLHLDNIDRAIIAATSRLTSALIVEAFNQLGCSLTSFTAGDKVHRVSYLPQYERLMEWVYSFLDTDARLVDVDVTTGQLTRTAIPVPRTSSEAILEELLGAYPDWAVASKLIYHAGKPLAQVLSGETDGIRILFGSPEGRELVAGLYRDHPFNIMLAGQMRELIHGISQRVQGEGPLKILEMGAGTGGTTVVLVPFLASLGIEVEYTFTDLSSSMVAAARRKFGQQYRFMKFAVHDIEKPPATELLGQHIIIASNAVHATHNLVVSATNIRSALRDDGFLMLLEQTECMPFSNIIFGLLEGWWLFDDGRTHAIVSTERWERDLQTSGFGHVDWTDGHLPENNIQRVIVALASGPIQERLPIPESPPDQGNDIASVELDITTRESRAENYVSQYTSGWNLQDLSTLSSQWQQSSTNREDAVVIVTGATGSLGSHLVASFAENPSVKSVVCINRPSSIDAETRQTEAFSQRGINLSSHARSKLRVFEVQTSNPHLGLATSDYEWLVQHGTHIVHNAWPMSGTRPISAFESQFQIMRNLLDLARDMALQQNQNQAGSRHRVGFQLVTSIGVVAKAGVPQVLEKRVPVSSVLPTGYCEGKWVCERMLDETLHQYPNLFRPMVVRPGQIAGSSKSGFWNPVEHFAFLVKSAHSLRAWPNLNGRMQWVPVDQSAATMAELLYIGEEAAAPEPYPVYHIDNPVGQSWKDMSLVLAGALDIAPEDILPFREWLRRVSRSPLAEKENPAAHIIDFLDRNFERMSCGGLILDTAKAQEHSKTMSGLGAVSAEVAQKYIKSWKETGFLV